MMVKPAESGGAEAPARLDAPAPDADDDADAVDALTGVGHDLPPGGETAAPGPGPGGGGRDGPRADAPPPPGAPARPTQPADDDESAKMLLLLGELGGADDSSAEEEEEEEAPTGRGSGKAPTRRVGGNGGVPATRGGERRRNARETVGFGDAPPGVPHFRRDDADEGGLVGGGAGQSGPVGEWLKAEGEARMKMADHRRLIYRWTNATFRLLGMKIPRGMGSLFDKGEKNKREKFDRFLSYYYGTETFEPGTYWYNNADTIQFFVELIRVATRDRYAPEPGVVQRLFRKKDPTRQASTWIMVAEELEKTDVTADELRALFAGEPRTEKGFPRGRPLFVPIPKNPKGHHKYTRGESGAAGPNSPQASPNPGARGEKTDRATLGRATGATTRGGNGGKAKRFGPGGAAAAAAGGGARPGPGTAAHAHASALAQSQQQLAMLGQLGAQFGLTEAQMAGLGRLSGFVGGGAAGGGVGDASGFFAGVGPRPGTLPPSLDPSSAAATRAAHRRATVAAAMANAQRLAPGCENPADVSAAAAKQREAAAAAAGACERVTLAPSPMGTTPFLTRVGSGLGSPRAVSGKKRSGSRLEAMAHAPVRRLAVARKIASEPEEDSLHRAETSRDAALQPPTRLVGDVLLGALGDVLGGVFGRVVSFHDDGDQKTDPAEAAAAGRERLMNLGEEVHAALPAVSAPGERVVDSKDDAKKNAPDPPSERGRSTREPVADRTALGAEVDSVLVAARAAESAWRRRRDAAARAAAAEAEAAAARDELAAAADDAEGARMARDALESDGGVSIMSGETRVGGFVSALDMSVREATVAALKTRVDELDAARVEKEEANARTDARATEARAAAAAAERTLKPAYEEVRKRALRLRLAAEERCERQIARVLSRAERDVAAWRARAKKEEEKANAEGAEERGEAFDARASLADAESALSVIKRSLDGCKTATEWSKSEIAKISSGRDV
jgi:hypothetical protein